MSSAEAILRASKVAADAIAAMFGMDCEVAVHDLRNPTHSLVHLANGHVTGRSLGAPIRDLILRVIPSLEKGEDVLAGYETILENGARLKSTTALIRDDDGHPLVAFCINYDVSRLEAAGAVLAELVGSREEKAPAIVDGGGESLDTGGLLSPLVDNVVQGFGVSGARLTREERLEVVGFLYGKGAFRIKGAVPLVARRLGVSEPTVYRYINQTRAKPETNDQGA